jgi:hypothetical protein
MKCCFCSKEFEGDGNNAQPLSEGRCCDDCNHDLVVPERISVLKNEEKDFKGIGELDDETLFKKMGITESDRLKNYQFTKKYWQVYCSSYGFGALKEKKDWELLISAWRTAWNKSLDEAKPFIIEEDVIPLLLNTECNDGNIPFPSFFIEAQVQIKERLYYGFHIGSYFTDNEKYLSVLSVFAENILDTKTGKIIRKFQPDYLILKQDASGNLSVKKDDKYHSKIRNFIFSFCSFINEPDVDIILHNLNPKNNLRRAERGCMPLPEFRKVTIKGKLRVYVDKQREDWQGGTHKSANYRYWVRGFYRHFFNKKRYAKIYELDDIDKRKLGFTWSDKHKDVLKIWVKPFIRGQGILIKQSWEVKE